MLTSVRFVFWPAGRDHCLVFFRRSRPSAISVTFLKNIKRSGDQLCVPWVSAIWKAYSLVFKVSHAWAGVAVQQCRKCIRMRVVFDPIVETKSYASTQSYQGYVQVWTGLLAHIHRLKPPFSGKSIKCLVLQCKNNKGRFSMSELFWVDWVSPATRSKTRALATGFIDMWRHG